MKFLKFSKLRMTWRQFALEPDNFQISEKTKLQAIDVNIELTAPFLQSSQLKFHKTLTDINIKQLQAATNQRPSGATDPLKLQDIAGSASAVSLAQELLSIPRAIVPKEAFDPEDTVADSMRLKNSINLSKDTLAVLKEKGIQIGSTSLTSKFAAY